jgi:hypothetical protein
LPKLGTINKGILPTVFGLDHTEARTELSRKRRALMAHWREHPWNWLTGSDLEERDVAPGIRGSQIVWTTDERDQDAPIKPFPNREYLYRWVCLLMDPEVTELLANKPRQMIFTTTTLLVFDWLDRFHPHRSTLVSKNIRERAEQLLKEKVRAVHERLPQWVRDELTASKTPQYRIDYGSGSTMHALSQNAAIGHFIGSTASAALVDEAAKQDQFGTMWKSGAPMCPKMVAVTTAEFSGAGAADFKAMLEHHPPLLVPELLNPDAPWPEKDKPRSFYDSRMDQPLKAWKVRKNSRGYTIVDLALEADPDKRNPEFLADAERRQSNRRQFLREYRGDWTSPSGSSYYSEFDAYGGREAYMKPCLGLIPGQPVVCGWDFGGRNPCWVALQRDPWNGRLWLLRELRAHGIGDTYSFRDLVLVLRGQLKLEDLSPNTASKVIEWLDVIAADPRFPAYPWFGPGIQFLDYSSREALRTTATAEDGAPRFDAEVLAARGVYLTDLPIGVKARENLVRKQLRLMEDGAPGLLIDPACPECLELFGGGLVYADPNKNNPLPDEPKRDNRYHDLHDALGYAVVGAVQNVSDAVVAPMEGRTPFKQVRQRKAHKLTREERRGLRSLIGNVVRRRDPGVYTRAVRYR